ncbi:MAG: hypothetical protein ABJH63_04840 [Rhizobiaceae bacterium]
MNSKLTKLIVASLIITGSSIPASGYSPDNHAKSIVDAAKLCRANHNIAISNSQLAKIIVGVEEPDRFSWSTLQMFKQRLEQGSYGAQRGVSTIRIAAQSIHGGPNPTRPIYKNTAADQLALSQTIRLPEKDLLPDRLALDVYSYDTNQSVRNKMLINASQYLCVSFAHKSDAQSARKFGNMMHMIGDTYSASHVQRSEPKGSLTNCGTEKIEWQFSMDLVSWKRHRAADLVNDDWRFNCLVQHGAEQIRLWSEGRQAVAKARNSIMKRKVASQAVRKSLRHLCQNVVRYDPATLSRPAGGASAAYSSAGGSDYWRLLAKQLPDKPIQPVGLTSAAEAEAFYRGVAAKLMAKGEQAEYFYPSRDMPDLCKQVLGRGPLHPALQCTKVEIESAMRGNSRVETMWLPARDLR